MSDERSEEQAPSVFGNLPASRPGTRSPRRAPEGSTDATAEPGPRPDPPGEADPPADPDPPAEHVPPRPRAAEREPAAEAPGDGPAGLEDLAWAGVAVAAEAATLGVRLATRAVETLRDAASRH